MTTNFGEEHHDGVFYEAADRAAASIGRDDVPAENFDRHQERLQQRQADWDAEDRREAIEGDTERLYALMRQEGVVPEDDTDEQGHSQAYNRIWGYVSGGRVPSWEWENVDERFPDNVARAREAQAFYARLAEIEARDAAGEWEEGMQIGQPIKRKPAEPK